MSELRKINILDRVLFFFYHGIFVFLSLLGLHFLSIEDASLESAFESLISSDNKNLATSSSTLNQVTLQFLKGDVRIHEDQFSGSERKAVENDICKTGFTLETKAESSVVINFGEASQTQIKVFPDTKIHFDHLKTLKVAGDDKKELTLMNLFKGHILVVRETVNPNVVLEVKTLQSRYSVEKGLLGIATDAREFYFSAVKTGSIKAENLKTLKYVLLTSGKSHFIDSSGRERESNAKAAFQLFPWDFQAAPNPLSVDAILAATGGPFVETSLEEAVPAGMSAEAIAELEADVKVKILEFQAESAKIKDELVSYQVRLADHKRRQDKEASRIYADIHCLETETQCDLYSEKLLLSRGFARIHQSSKMVKSIVEDLQKYLQEQRNLMASDQQRVEYLTAVEKKRSDALIWAQSRLVDKSQFNNILSHLNDGQLLP